jgi:hypothetical protein
MPPLDLVTTGMSKLVMSAEVKRTKLIVGIDYGTTFSGMFVEARSPKS